MDAPLLVSLRKALADIDPAEEDFLVRGKAIAARLCGILQARQPESAIVEVYFWANTVEFVLRGGEHWAIECLSPDDFRMYPGFVRGDTVSWANIWVRPTNMSLDELVNDITNVAFHTTKEEFQNA